MLLIRGERNRQLVLVAKRLLGLGGVGRDAEYGGTVFLKSRGKTGEVDGLFGAARRVGARIEINNEFKQFCF